MRLMRCLLVSGSAAVMAGSLMLAGESAVTTAAAPGRTGELAAHQPSARFLAKARTALVRYLRNSDPLISAIKPGTPNDRPTNTPLTSSFNWSGYADTSTTTGAFTQVSGRWTTPRVRCTREDEITSEWVGLDGYSSLTVEQDGTISWCFEGQPTYFTWYEMYPASTVEVGDSLRPGDTVAAKVSRSGTSYRLSLTDFTRPANSFSVTKKCALTTCEDTSAEWIAERPALQVGIAPLADYSPWTLSEGSETASGTPGTISSYSSNNQIDMVDATDTYPLSTTSGLNAPGTRFTTHWNDSY